MVYTIQHIYLKKISLELKNIDFKIDLKIINNCIAYRVCTQNQTKIYARNKMKQHLRQFCFTDFLRGFSFINLRTKLLVVGDSHQKVN